MSTTKKISKTPIAPVTPITSVTSVTSVAPITKKMSTTKKISKAPIIPITSITSVTSVTPITKKMCKTRECNSTLHEGNKLCDDYIVIIRPPQIKYICNKCNNIKSDLKNKNDKTRDIIKADNFLLPVRRKQVK